MCDQTMNKICEAEFVNDGLIELERGKVVDGDTARAMIMEKYNTEFESDSVPHNKTSAKTIL